MVSDHQAHGNRVAAPEITPLQARLASEGTRFTSARSVLPICSPARASMLTGLYPIRHTVRDNGLWALPDSARTLAEVAREAGVQTAAGQVAHQPA